MPRLPFGGIYPDAGDRTAAAAEVLTDKGAATERAVAEQPTVAGEKLVLQGAPGQTVGVKTGENGEVLPPELAEGDEALDFSNDIQKGAQADMNIDAFMLDGGGAGPAAQYFTSGVDWSRGGPGMEGKDRYEAAVDVGPQMLGEAFVEGADVTNAEGQDLAKHYKEQARMATNKAAWVENRRREDDEELRRRDEELKLQTAKYSQDLADNRKFWQQPGNIIAAIGFALLPLGSDDPTIGIRTLDAAIQADWNMRKKAADMHLGELRSNMSGYRQIARDREAGDQLALSESYRIAAMEVQKISASYQGQKAQAAAKAMIADLMTKSNLTAMEVFNKLFNIDPRLVNPGMMAALRARPGFQEYGKKAPAAGQPGQPGAGGAPSTATVKAPGFVENGQRVPVVNGPGGQSKWYPGMEIGKGAVVANRSEQPPGGPGRDSKFEKFVGSANADLQEERSPGSLKALDNAKQILTAWAVARLGNQPKTEGAIKKEKAAILWEMKGDLDKITERTQKDVAGLTGFSRFQSDLRDLDAAFKGDEGKVNQFIGELRGIAPGAYADMENLMGKYGIGSKDERRVRNAVIRFRQALGKNINAYFKDTSGGAVSDAEQKRLDQVISMNAPWSAIKNFVDSVSRERAANIRNALGSGKSSIAAQYWLARTGMQFPILNSIGKPTEPNRR